jgi:hypothetical protein
MNRKILIAIIVSCTVLVALLDFGTSAEFVGSILFTFPIALCALQGSKPADRGRHANSSGGALPANWDGD